MRALPSPGQKNDKLYFMLTRSNRRIYGTSYIQSPKDSGYNRSAPYSIQYISENEKFIFSYENDADFSKLKFSLDPGETLLKDLTTIYADRSAGTTQAKDIAPLVDAFVRTALSESILLVSPRQGSNAEDIKRTISYAMTFLPSVIGKKIRFFSSLPVFEGETDCLNGFDNAVRLQANVIFCPLEYINRLKSYRSFDVIDLEHPNTNIGYFADMITSSRYASSILNDFDQSLFNQPSYEALNNEMKRRYSSPTSMYNSPRQITTNNRQYQSNPDTTRKTQKESKSESFGTFGNIVIYTICAIALIVALIIVIPWIQQQFKAIEPEVTNSTTPRVDQTDYVTQKPISENTDMIIDNTIEKQDDNAITEQNNITKQNIQIGAQDEVKPYESIENPSPDTRTIRSYAKVKGNTVNLRSESNKKSKSIETYNTGDYVWIEYIITTPQEDEKEWARVKIVKDGNEGYISNRFIELLEQKENDEYLNNHPAPTLNGN